MINPPSQSKARTQIASSLYRSNSTPLRSLLLPTTFIPIHPAIVSTNYTLVDIFDRIGSFSCSFLRAPSTFPTRAFYSHVRFVTAGGEAIRCVTVLRVCVRAVNGFRPIRYPLHPIRYSLHPKFFMINIQPKHRGVPSLLLMA
jgi:hypothetical protein